MVAKEHTAVIAAGCFWGVEELIRQKEGVIRTQVGYTGGHCKLPTYKQMTTGKTGHAEAIRIDYNSEILPLAELFRLFFQLHDPTTLNQQGNDKGSQYRSAIFYANTSEKQQAQTIIKEVSTWGLWQGDIVTTLEPLGEFYPAEKYHQKYLQQNPNGYSCHFWRPIPTRKG